MTITGAGTVTVRASQSGSADWNAAANVDQSFTVAKTAVTVTADSKTRVYGAVNPTFTASYSGFVNGDTASVLSGSPSLTTSATTNSTVAGSPYTITAAVGTLSSANYSFNFGNGALTITKATLTVTADHQIKVYGAADPALTFHGSGFQFSETATSVLHGPEQEPDLRCGKSCADRQLQRLCERRNDERVERQSEPEHQRDDQQHGCG